MGAALLGESFVRLTGIDPGFQIQQTLTAHVSLPRSRYPDGPSRISFAERTLDRLRAAPGIAAAGTIDALAIADDRQGTGFTIEKEAPSDAVESANVNFAFVSPGYFEAMGIPLLAGRNFDMRDHPESAPTIVINQSMARRYFGGRDPIGRRITVGFNTRATREVVGIVGDERHVSLDREAPPGLYVSYLQLAAASRLTLVIRTAGDPGGGCLDRSRHRQRDRPSTRGLRHADDGTDRRGFGKPPALLCTSARDIRRNRAYSRCRRRVRCDQPARRSAHAGVRALAFSLGFSDRRRTARRGLWVAACGDRRGPGHPRCACFLAVVIGAPGPASTLRVQSPTPSSASCSPSLPRLPPVLRARRATRVDPLLALRAE